MTVITKKNILQCCSKKKSWFTRFGDSIPNGEGHLIFQDNGARVLAVGHLDAVLYSSPRIRGNRIYCPQLDDRLGVATILNLPAFVQVDILLTDNEERGRSTACFFDAPRQYNWIVEFDRQGTGCVTYQYDDPAWVNAIKANALYEYGSYSDIVDLGHLKASGVNWGVGYHNQHTQNCFVDVREHDLMVRQFLDFYRANHKKSFPHVDRAPMANYTWTKKEYHYKAEQYYRAGFCEYCGHPKQDDRELLCAQCLEDIQDRITY